MATPGRSPNEKEAAAKGNASSPKNLAKKKKDEEWDEDEEEDEDEDEDEEDGDEDEEDEDFEEEDEDLEDEDFDDEEFDDEDFDDEDLDEDDDDDDDLDDDESEDEEGEDEELKKGGKTKKAAPARATSRAKPPPADPVAAAGAKTSNLYRNVSAAKEEPAKDAKRSRFGEGVAGSSSAAGTSSKRSTAKASGVQPATGRASGRASGRGSGRAGGGPPKRDNFKLVVILICLLMLLACLGLGAYLIFNKPAAPEIKTIERNPGKEVKADHAKARTLANKARDAMKEEKLEEALQFYKDAKMALDDCATKIEMFRENPQFSGDEYAGWETIGQSINSDLYLVNDEIFKIENRIANEKRKAQQAVDPASNGGGEKTEPPAPAENKTPVTPSGDEFGPDAERGPTDG